MFLRLFRGTGPGVIFLIIITLVLLWISAFLHPQLPDIYIFETRPMPLYSVIKFLIGKHPLPGVIFSFAVLSLLLFLLVNFNTSVFFINERTFLPAIIYVLFSALFPEQQQLNPALPATLLLMLAVKRIMDSYRKTGTASNFFDAALLISIGSLIYADLIWFGLLVFIGIALLRTWNINEVSISLLGLVTPYVLVFGLYYVLGKDLDIFLGDIRENLFSDSPEYSFPRLTIIILIYSGLITIVSTVYLMRRINSKKIRSRKTFYLLLWGFFISLAVYLILPSASVEMVWFMTIPLCYLMTHYFVFLKKNIVPEIIFSGFFLLLSLVQVLYIF
jgi:hypothetical protein